MDQAKAGPESLPKWCGYRPAGGWTSSDTSHAQIQDFEFARPNIFPIDDLMKYPNGPILQIQSYRIDLCDIEQLTGYLRGVSVQFQY